MTGGRPEAFSDGVIAILITLAIMLFHMPPGVYHCAQRTCFPVRIRKKYFSRLLPSGEWPRIKYVPDAIRTG